MPVRRSRPLLPTGCGDGRCDIGLRPIGRLERTLIVAKAVLDMNDMRSPNKMVEATRLTRAGRLTEATALLQRMLRAEPPPI
jgi:hypothetical protein